MKLSLHTVFGLGVLLCLGTCCAHAQEQRLIEAVKVAGNDYIPAEGIRDEVKDILRIGESFTAERAKATRDAIMAMGYFDDVQVTTESSAKGVTVVITVVEKQRIQKVLFVGNTVIADTALTDAVFTRVGHVIDDRIIRRDVRRIEDFYAQQGYIAHVSKASVGQFGVLTFVIEEARIEDIIVEGLKRTKELVVRRELTLQAGELFQEKRVARDIQKVFNLGLFKNVRSDIRPGVKDPQRGIIVVISIEEKRTGQASVAAGYSSLDDFVLVLNVSENNFRGRGERAAVNLELFGRTSYELSFFEPYVDSKGTSFSVRLYDTERQRRFVGGSAISTADDTFDERRTGTTFSFSKPIDEMTRGSLRFRSEKVSSSYFQGTRTLGQGGALQQPGGVSTQQTNYTGGNTIPPPDNPGLEPDIPGPGDTPGPIIVAAPLHPGGRLSSVTLGWTRDTRNLVANPTAGKYLSVSWEEAASFLGGDTAFRKLQLEQRLYRQLSNRRDVIAARFIGGLSFGDLPLFESYSVGGSNTLRGYDEDRYRGEKMMLLNLEYRRPVTDKLTAVGFVDVGGAFGGTFPTIIPGFTIPAEDKDFKAHVGVGVGLRVILPIGPIRLDFGWGDDGSQAHFNFGHTF
jgi:outer membrane protein insertion porin family